MSSKVKRLNRTRDWRITRRKKEAKKLLLGKGRNRKPREKNKKKTTLI